MEQEINNNLRDALIKIADILLIQHNIVVKICCQKDGTELMRNGEEQYYKCSKCGDIWNWKGKI